MKFSAFALLVFFAFGMANAGIIIRPRVELDSAYDKGLKTYEVRQKDIDSVEPYLNGPDVYWARGVEARQDSTFYTEGPGSRLTRDVTNEDDFDSSLAFANTRDSRWVRDLKHREEGVDSNVPYANGPSSFWVRDAEVLRSVPFRQAEADSPNHYGNGPDAYFRDLKVEAREEETDSSVSYSRGPTSYWVRNAEDD